MAGGAWLAAGMPFFTARGAYADFPVEGALEILERAPLNAQTLPQELMRSWITPQDKLYIRTHGTIPELDEKSFRLKVSGMVEKPLDLSLEELKQQFGHSSMLATMQCAGNRRSEMAQEKPIEGNPWGTTAIGNAEWSGVRLQDVLDAAGVKEGAKHVWFNGLDEVNQKGEKIHFGGSIPLEVAGDALLAFLMNGEPLTAPHGFPLRAVVPGYIGARSVKWLHEIVVADKPSDNHFVAKAYKITPPEMDSKNVDWNVAPPMYELPVNAAILSPPAGAKVPAGKLRIEGWAFPSGGRGTRLDKVEVSTDGGKTWKTAEFTSPEALYCWRLWRAEVPVDAQTSEIIVCATDSAGNMMPEKTPWNFKGYGENAWHRVPVTVA